jgi:hypothetical protein
MTARQGKTNYSWSKGKKIKKEREINKNTQLYSGDQSPPAKRAGLE